MREWREARKAEAVATMEMPADLKRVIENSVALVWTTASKLASAATEAARKEAAAAIDSAEAERDEALEEVGSLEKKLSAKEKEFAQARTLLEQERDSNKILSSDKSALVARLADRDDQIKQLKAELGSLQRELIEIARANKK
jgi:chromosome segregation ATPase